MDTAPRETEATPAPGGRTLAQIVWQRKYFLLLGAVLGLALGVTYHTLTKPAFQASGQLLIAKRRPDTLTGTPTSGLPEDFVSLQLSILRSPLTVRPALQLVEQRGVVLGNVGSDGPEETVLRRLAATRGKDALGGPNNVVQLTYRGATKEEAVAVLGAVVKCYQDILAEKYSEVSGDVVKQVVNVRDGVGKDLHKKQTEYEQFRARSPLLWRGKDWVNARQDGLNSIVTKRAALLVRRAEVRARLDALQQARDAGRSPEVIIALLREWNGRPDVEGTKQQPAPNLQAELVNLLKEEERITKHYGADHHQTKSIKNSIARVRQLLSRPNDDGKGDATAAAVEPWLDQLRQQLAYHDKEIAGLDDLYAKEHEQAKELTTYEVQEETLRNDLTRLQQLYDTLLKKLQDTDFAARFGGLEATELAKPSESAVKQVEPNLLLVVAVAVLAAGVLGAGLALLAEATDRGFHGPDDVRVAIGARVLGEVPRFHGADRAEPGALATILCTAHRPQSPEAEAFRALRTTLLSLGGTEHHVLQVAGPEEGDGVSVVAANLAVSLARAGKRVALVDANLRRPRQHQLFGVQAKSGLATYLAGGAGLGDAVQPTIVNGLDVVPAGPPPLNPAELLSSAGLRQAIEALRDAYDYVLIDTPAVLGVTDPCVVAGRVDHVLLAVRDSRATRPMAVRARGLLQAAGAVLVGVVVTRVARGGSYRGHTYAA